MGQVHLPMGRLQRRRGLGEGSGSDLGGSRNTSRSSVAMQDHLANDARPDRSCDRFGTPEVTGLLPTPSPSDALDTANEAAGGVGRAQEGGRMQAEIGKDVSRVVRAPSLGRAWLEATRIILAEGHEARYEGSAIVEIALMDLVIDNPRVPDELIQRLGDPERISWMHANFTEHVRVAELGDAAGCTTPGSTTTIEVLRYRQREGRRQRLFSSELYRSLNESALAAAASVDWRFEALGDCYRKLPEEDRRLLDARYQAGTTVEAIAAAAGRSVHSVYRALRRIHEALFDCVGQSAKPHGKEPKP